MRVWGPPARVAAGGHDEPATRRRGWPAFAPAVASLAGGDPVAAAICADAGRHGWPSRWPRSAAARPRAPGDVRSVACCGSTPSRRPSRARPAGAVLVVQPARGTALDGALALGRHLGRGAPAGRAVAVPADGLRTQQSPPASGPPRRRTGRALIVAEDRGFEPLRAFTQHAFQACALGHYANPPSRKIPEGTAPVPNRPSIEVAAGRISALPRGSTRVGADPPRGGTSLNSPRAGMQQGQVSSSRYVGGPLMSDVTVRVRNVTTALYRRYRPETFADVIGQEHVTEPLMQALRTGRVNHAYLFSGPRGCGKTTSARILARCLNCEQGPTADPLRRLRLVRGAGPRRLRLGRRHRDRRRLATVASTTPATCASGRPTARRRAASRSTSSTRRTW